MEPKICTDVGLFDGVHHPADGVGDSPAAKRAIPPAGRAPRDGRSKAIAHPIRMYRAVENHRGAENQKSFTAMPTTAHSQITAVNK